MKKRKIQLNCIIDDIDINEKHNLKENTNYLLIQLSETGEDFDFSFLFLKDNKYYLIKLLDLANSSIQLGESLSPKDVSNEQWFIKISDLKNNIQMEIDLMNQKEENEKLEQVKNECKSILDEI